MKIMVETSIGELVDKLTILEIKLVHIRDPHKRVSLETEHASLSGTFAQSIQADQALLDLKTALREVNQRIWDLEDEVRDCERQGDFGDVFIRVSRAIYRTNDERAETKRRINLAYGSSLVEEKSYAAY